MREKRIIIGIASILFFCLKGYSQTNLLSNEVENFNTSSFSIGLGGILTSFQDIKYSNARYSGIGTNLSFGYEKISTNYFSTNLNFMYSNEKAKTHGLGKTKVLNGVIDISYLIPIFKKEKQRIYLGTKWDVLDAYFRETEGLNNNSVQYVFGSNLKFASMYERTISDKVKLRAGFNFQVLSFMKESTSFGFSAPQDALENGKFSYQNDKLEAPLGFKYYTFEPFTKYLNIDTQVEMHYKKSWIFTYKWNMQRSNKVKNYPMSRGYSSLSVKYKF